MIDKIHTYLHDLPDLIYTNCVLAKLSSYLLHEQNGKLSSEHTDFVL